MRILVLGAAGMAGHAAACFLQERGHTVRGFARRKLSFCDTVAGDAEDPAALQKAVCAEDYDAVINCIGVLNRDVDESPARGIYLNSVLPHLLAEYTAGGKTRIVHLSTDCVFSGMGSGGYTEKSFRDADSLYGRSKALGELEDEKNLTIRTSIVGPDMRADGKGLFNWFMQQTQAVTGYRRAVWTGVSTMELAKAIEAALQQNITGLYHLVNQESISKYELLKKFNAMRKTPVGIMADDEIIVNKSLVNTRRDFDYSVPSYTQMVKGMETWIWEHPSFYPQYERKEREI